MRRKDHPNLSWVIDHMVFLYIALVVSIILPVVIAELFQ